MLKKIFLLFLMYAITRTLRPCFATKSWSWQFQMYFQFQKIQQVHDKAPTYHSRNEQ